MKILILGAGRTGASVAQALAGEENDIVVIDYNVQLLEALKEHVKMITTVVGNAAHPLKVRRMGCVRAVWLNWVLLSIPSRLERLLLPVCPPTQVYRL